MLRFWLKNIVARLVPDEVEDSRTASLTSTTGGAMQEFIAILEDDGRRITAMRRLLFTELPRYRLQFIVNAPDMIEWLGHHLPETRLICLDHDLGLSIERDGEMFDAGTGRDVVDYLLTQEPACPVIVHSSNSIAAAGMEFALDEAGWTHRRVVPFDDLEWIESDWTPECAKATLTPHGDTFPSDAR